MSGRYHFRRGNYHYKPMELEYGRKVLSHIFKRNNYYTMTIGKPQVSRNFNQNCRSKFSVEISSRKLRSNFWAIFSVEISVEILAWDWCTNFIFSPSKTKSEKIMTIEITFSKKELDFGLSIDHFHPDHIVVFLVEVTSKTMLLWPHSTDGQFLWIFGWKTRAQFKSKAQTRTHFGKIRTTGIS